MGQNTDALRTANAATTQANFQAMAGTFTNDREAGAIILRALEADPSLTPVERVAAAGWFFNCLKAGELAYHQYVKGQLDPEVWRATQNHFRAYYETPGMRDYWEIRRHSFVPGFQAEVDRWLGDTTIGPSVRSDELFGPRAGEEVDGGSDDQP